jgi:Protein of unknown function (DUF2865)
VAKEWRTFVRVLVRSLVARPLTRREEVEQMVALDGDRYADLANAFRYRTEYVANCRCKPEPWSAEAKADYERRAVIAAQTPEQRTVAAGVAEAAKILAGGDIEIAQGDAGYSQAGAYRPRFYARYRFSRYSSNLPPQLPQPRRFLLFGNGR